MAFPVLAAAMDRAAFSVLGGPVTYATSTGDVLVLTGIFEAGYVRADADQVGVVSRGPALLARLEDFVTADGRAIDPVTDPDPTVKIDGTAYSVWEARPDGIGGVVLFLHEAG